MCQNHVTNHSGKVREHILFDSRCSHCNAVTVVDDTTDACVFQALCTVHFGTRVAERLDRCGVKTEITKHKRVLVCDGARAKTLSLCNVNAKDFEFVLFKNKSRLCRDQKMDLNRE